MVIVMVMVIAAMRCDAASIIRDVSYLHTRIFWDVFIGISHLAYHQKPLSTQIHPIRMVQNRIFGTTLVVARGFNLASLMLWCRCADGSPRWMSYPSRHSIRIACINCHTRYNTEHYSNVVYYLPTSSFYLLQVLTKVRYTIHSKNVGTRCKEAKDRRWFGGALCAQEYPFDGWGR
jgi:hypothetical protein